VASSRTGATTYSQARPRVASRRVVV
jgi:hypothetical protein